MDNSERFITGTFIFPVNSETANIFKEFKELKELFDSKLTERQKLISRHMRFLLKLGILIPTSFGVYRFRNIFERISKNEKRT